MTGLRACLSRGADVIVHTGTDDLYSADDIAVLMQPILEGRVDIVICSRPIDAIDQFSPYKRLSTGWQR
jgi:hypothetical protein